MRKSILNLDLKELEKNLADWGEKSFHAKQIFSWIYEKGVRDFNKMSDLSADLRKKLIALNDTAKKLPNHLKQHPE